jgi:hypothetical protein
VSCAPLGQGDRRPPVHGARPSRPRPIAGFALLPQGVVGLNCRRVR